MAAIMSIIRGGHARKYWKSAHDMKTCALSSMGVAVNAPSQLRNYTNSRSYCLSMSAGSRQCVILVSTRCQLLLCNSTSDVANCQPISALHSTTSASHTATCQPISSSNSVTWRNTSESSAWHNIPVSAQRRTFHLDHFLMTSENTAINSSDNFCRKDNESNHTNEKTILSNPINFFSHLLASFGLAYIIYKIATSFHDLPSFLSVASCSSQETQLEQEATQSSNSSSSGKFHKTSKAGSVAFATKQSDRMSFHEAVERTQKLCQRRKDEVGSPGIVVCVSVDGRQIYAEGFGYADLENEIPMKPNSVLRIASISKAITATIVAKAWENGLIDLEKSVQHYIPSFPQKEFMGEKVDITIQQLLSHTSGIRHYKPKDDPVYAFDKPIAELVGVVKGASWQPFYKIGPNEENKMIQDSPEKKDDKIKSEKKEVSEMQRDEYYLTKHFPTTAESLTLFASDPLVARPGTKYLYTTFAFTVLAAVVEAISKSPFTEAVTRTLKQMGLRETYLDYNRPIIYNRARYYVKDAQGKVVNAPHVDNSYKWAGGGLLSTSQDMVKFGNILLYSAQHDDADPGPPGFLKSSTMWKFWTPQIKSSYGLGFQIWPGSELFGMCDPNSFGAGHTGAAVGVSSALFILPRRSTLEANNKTRNSKYKSTTSSRNQSALQAVNTLNPVKSTITTNTFCAPEKDLYQKAGQSVVYQLPHGVVVCIIINMISVSVQDIAEEIARIFEKVDFTL